MENKQNFITVRDFYQTQAKSLGLKIAGGVNGLDNRIDNPRVQNLGLGLARYTEYLRKGRIQILGRTENNFLNKLSSSDRGEAVEGIFTAPLTCILITAGITPIKEIIDGSVNSSVPVLTTGMDTERAIDKAVVFLEERLAPQTSIHGVLLDVLGLGVLIIGNSGMGKSECGLDLMMRGHRLISDDMVVIRRLGSGRLVGSGPKTMKYYMELRGMGVVNVRELFGISSVSPQKELALAIRLIKWGDYDGSDRIGMEEHHFEILDASIPQINLPVAPGRSLADLVEVAVRIHMLRREGYEPASEFLKRLERELREQE